MSEPARNETSLIDRGLVIVPTYNERENVARIIESVLAQDPRLSVLIVDDGSPDGTGAIVDELATQSDRVHVLHRAKKMGLGTAYLAGFKWALARDFAYVFEMDADFSHNPDDLLRLHDACAVQGYDLAIGSRYIQGVNVVNWPMSRVLMSYYASWYVRLVTGMPIRDATAGFKCYTARVLRALDLNNIRFVGYAFQIEMKWLAYQLGFRIKEVPIIFTDRTRGTSKMSKGIVEEAFFGVLQMKLSSWLSPVKRVAQRMPEPGL